MEIRVQKSDQMYGAFDAKGRPIKKFFAMEKCIFLPVCRVIYLSHVGHWNRNVVFMGYKI